jgi:isopentenyl-diphosphate delta-isomerase
MLDQPEQFTPWFLHTFPRIPHTFGDFRLTA